MEKKERMTRLVVPSNWLRCEGAGGQEVIKAQHNQSQFALQPCISDVVLTQGKCFGTAKPVGSDNHSTQPHLVCVCEARVNC